jgi:hypothetical protein
MNIIELAKIKYEEEAAREAEFLVDQREKSRAEFLLAAAKVAAARLDCADVGKFDWQYTPSDSTPGEIEEATAVLIPGETAYLRYRFDHAVLEESFDLVRPCAKCSHERVDPIQGLADLGRVLLDTSAGTDGTETSFEAFRC